MTALLWVADHHRGLLIGAGVWTVVSVAVALAAGQFLRAAEVEEQRHVRSVRHG